MSGRHPWPPPKKNVSVRNATLRRVPRTLAFCLAFGCVMLVLGLGDQAANWSHMPASWARTLWPQARGAVPFELRFARAYNKAAAHARTDERIDAIACAHWKASLDSCDVVLRQPSTGRLACMVVAVDVVTFEVYGGRRVACSAAARQAAQSDGGPKA